MVFFVAEYAGRIGSKSYGRLIMGVSRHTWADYLYISRPVHNMQPGLILGSLLRYLHWI